MCESHSVINVCAFYLKSGSGDPFSPFVAQELGAELGVVWVEGLRNGFESPSVGGPHTVPRLGRAIVQIVHTVQVHVLRETANTKNI